MGKFHQIANGARATKRVSVPYGSDDDGGEIVCLVRPLKGHELASALENARAFAKSRGLEEPKPGAQLYELGLWVHTILLGCRCEEDTEAPYFDSAEQILEHLDPDRIALLYEHQQRWQDECSPRQHQLSEVEYVASVLEMANAGDEAELPFERWAPALRGSWVRTSARLLASLDVLKSPYGSASATSSKSATA
jgi:hypothetical protein